MIFSYRAKSGPSEVTEGRIDAGSEKEAIEKLSQRGLIPLKLIPREGGQDAVPEGAAAAPGGAARPSSRAVTLFTRQLASLLKAGVPILKALRIIVEQADDRALKGMLKAVYKEIEQGAVMSASLSRYPASFSPLYIAMVRAGEDSGQLPQVLFKIAQYRIREEEMISRFRAAMAYPVLMAAVGVGTVIFMLTFVLPRLSKLYADMGQTLPLPTRIVIGVSGALQHWGLLMLALAGGLVFLLARFLRTKQGKMAWSGFQLAVPLLRGFVVKLELARFSRTMELLLRSGINILRALYITLPVMGNEILKAEVTKSYADLEQGGSFGQSLRNSARIPLFMSNLLIVGEESGKLDDSLAELAECYERDTDETLKAIGGLLEPVLILFMGLVVGFIVVAMLLPVFDMNAMVR